MVYLNYALKLLLRNKRRTLAYLFGLVLAVGLFSSILFFVDASAGRMTISAVKPVPVDMQLRSTLAQPDLSPVMAALKQDSFVTTVEPVVIADFASLALPDGTHTTPAGKVFVLNPSYYEAFKSLRLLRGQPDPSGIMISQAAANALNLTIGDTVAIGFDQMPQPYQATVTGIVDPTGAYFLFAATDPAHEGEYNPQPYDIFMTPQRWQTELAGILTTPLSGDASGKSISAQKPQYELHIQTDHTLLPSDPVKALAFVNTLSRRIEKQFPGEVKITNNLAGALKQAKSDALWAKLLFLFLGMPGVVLSAYLSKYATDLLVGPQRQEISLLRARGATPRQIMLTMGLASLLMALAGTFLGLVIGFLTTSALFGWQALTLASLALYAHSAIYAFLGGLFLTAFATYLPIRTTLKMEISTERRHAEREIRSPFWARAYLDVFSLLVAGVIFWVTRQGGGFKPVEGAEGATMSLGFFVFLAPFFLWIGLTLLLSRVLAGGISLSAGSIQHLLHGLFGDLGTVASKSIARRSTKIASAVIVISLALSFGISLSIFVNTYQTQKAVDARYELGSDIKLTPANLSQQTAVFADSLSNVSGVDAVTPVQRTQAYVGSSLQTVFGIDAATYANAVQPSDDFFVGISAADALQALATTPDGVLVSQELATAYDVRPGDPVIIRLPDIRSTNGQYIETHLQVVGVIRFFPTTQQDTFLIMNQKLMQQVTHSDKVNYFLIKTNVSPAKTAASIKSTLGQHAEFKVEDIDTAVLALGSSITSLNLKGLSSIEIAYTVLIISLGLGIFLLAIVYERAREFGAMRAVGASPRQVSNFLWGESLVVGITSVSIGVGIGLVLGRVFVTLLKMLYTIPPSRMSVPWMTILLLLVLATLGVSVSTMIANSRLIRMDVASVLREL